MTGVEPATLCLASTRSSQLSYTRRAAATIDRRPRAVNRTRRRRGAQSSRTCRRIRTW